MTVDEQKMIDDLVQRIRSTQVEGKDADAEQRLQQGLAGYPDALYVLAQTVIVQKYGLEQAQQKLQAQQAELDQLHQQSAPAAPAKPAGSFLSSFFGAHDPPQNNAGPGYQAPQPPYQPVNQPGYAAQGYPQPPYGGQAYPPQGYPQQGYPQGGYGQPGYGSPMGGGGGFLRGAMQAAAGVAMGEIAFQGMESLFHGFGGGGYGGHGFEEGRPTEVINNNYYDDAGSEHHHEASTDRDDSSFYNPKDDASRDDSGSDKFADTDDSKYDAQDDSGDDGTRDSADDNSGDDFSSDDNSNNVDGGF